MKKTSKRLRLLATQLEATQSLEELQAKVEELGFRFQDSGAYKYVYRTRRKELRGYTVKVYRHRHAWSEDSYRVPRAIKRLYLHPVYKSRRFLIQPWANRKRKPDGTIERIEKTPRILKAFSKHDVRTPNLAVHNGKQVIIDFSY